MAINGIDTFINVKTLITQTEDKKFTTLLPFLRYRLRFIFYSVTSFVIL